MRNENHRYLACEFPQCSLLIVIPLTVLTFVEFSELGDGCSLFI